MKKMNVGIVLLIEVLVVLIGLFANMNGDFGRWNAIIVHFIDPPTLCILLIFSVPPLLATGLWRDFLRAFSVGKKKYTITQLKRCLEAVSVTQKIFLISGIFTSFVSFVMMLSTLDDLSELGPYAAVICLAGIYTVVIEFLLLPVKTNVQLMIIHEMEMDNEEE